LFNHNAEMTPNACKRPQKLISSPLHLYLYQGLKKMAITVPYLKGYVRDFISLLNPLIKDAPKFEPSELIFILREGLNYDQFIAEDDIPSPDDSNLN